MVKESFGGELFTPSTRSSVAMMTNEGEVPLVQVTVFLETSNGAKLDSGSELESESDPNPIEPEVIEQHAHLL